MYEFCSKQQSDYWVDYLAKLNVVDIDTCDLSQIKQLFSKLSYSQMTHSLYIIMC